MKTETLELLNKQKKKAVLARNTFFDYAEDVMYRENKTLEELQELGFIVYDDEIGLPKGTEFTVKEVSGPAGGNPVFLFYLKDNYEYITDMYADELEIIF